MAEANISVTVTVERLVHETLSELAQKIAKEHGIIITGVSFDWIHMLGSTPHLACIRIDSELRR